MKPPIKNILSLEPSQEQKATVPKSIPMGLRMPRKMCTNRQINRHFFIYKSRDVVLTNLTEHNVSYVKSMDKLLVCV